MATEPTPTDAELVAMRAEFGITSNGRGIKEFTQVRDFARAILARWGAQPAPAASPVPLPDFRAYALIDSMGWDLDDLEKDDMLRLLRATEASHGITKGA